MAIDPDSEIITQSTVTPANHGDADSTEVLLDEFTATDTVDADTDDDGNGDATDDGTGDAGQLVNDSPAPDVFDGNKDDTDDDGNGQPTGPTVYAMRPTAADPTWPCSTGSLPP